MTASPDSVAPVRPAVLAAVLGYDRDALAPFVASFLRHLPHATLVLFTAGMDPPTLRWLAGLPRVRVVPDHFNRPRIPRGWRLVFEQTRKRLAHGLARGLVGASIAAPAGDDPIAEALYSIVIQRFFRYRRFLDQCGGEFTHVLLTDLRDVVFQADPFPCAGLHVFAEDERIGQSHFARRWFQLSYGWRSWRRWADLPFLNVGTVLGDLASTRRYLDAACAEFHRRHAYFWGADMAVHNHLVHSRQVDAVVHAYGEGAILTLNSVPLSRLRVENGRVLDARGAPYPVLHQYDRVHGLALDLPPCP